MVNNGKLCIIILTIALIPLLMLAQVPDTLWTRMYGGIGDDRAYSVHQTTDGGYIIAGRTSSVNPPNVEACLIKTNSNGDSVWMQTYGAKYAKSVVQTSDGGYIWTGHTGESLCIVKTDSIGDTLWYRNYKGGNYLDFGEYVQQTTDGRYVVVGMTSRITGVEYQYSIFLLRVDYNGDTLWTRTFGWHFAACGRSVEQTYDAGFIIIGYRLGDICLIKTDSNGNQQWMKNYGGVGNEEAYSVQQTPDSGYICVGKRGSLHNIYIIRTNANGDTLWTRSYGGSGHDEGFCLRNMLDGNYIIAGYSRSYGNGSLDVYLIKIDDNGDSLWARVYGGDSIDLAYEIELTSDGGYIVIGYTNSYGAGAYDIWLLKLGTDLGVEEQTNIPSSDEHQTRTFFTDLIRLPNCKNCKIFDITGREIHTLNPAPGIYFIEIDGKIIQKVVIVR